jgi:hypothetical protein
MPELAEAPKGEIQEEQNQDAAPKEGENPPAPSPQTTEKKFVKKRGPYNKNREKEQEAPKSAEDQHEAPPQAGPMPELFSPKQEKAAREAGKKAILMLINFPGLYNPDLIPKSEDEVRAAAAFMEAGGEYFVSQKLGDLPPGMALAMAGLGYYVVLLAAERNKGFIKETWAKAKGAWAWWRAKRSVK